jgi:hypothetical protein
MFRTFEELRTVRQEMLVQLEASTDLKLWLLERTDEWKSYEQDIAYVVCAPTAELAIVATRTDQDQDDETLYRLTNSRSPLTHDEMCVYLTGKYPTHYTWSIKLIGEAAPGILPGLVLRHYHHG